MSRHRRGAWGGAGMWPFMIYGQQPGGGWSEQTMGMGFGQRPARPNDLLSPPSDQALSLDALSSLFTRLILQNHLTRLASDSISPGGRGGLWGCNAPALSCSQNNACSSSSSSCPSHNQQSSSCGGGINMCGHTNNINVCHSCPSATRPYLASNNVFVIPGNLGNFSLSHNNLNTLLSGLGLAMGSVSDVGGGMGGPAVNNGPTFTCRGCNFQL